MQTWSEHSPYQSVNLYIGGANRTCSNHVLISSYLFQLNQQGWKFFPTWVGPQAPCTNFLSRISSDVTTAYQQGANQADLAVERLAELGLTGPAKTGSVVYYDMENYGTDNACRAAVNAFMNGWVAQIHTRGNLAGVYGSTLCNTGLSDFQFITNVPDVIWPARWYHNTGEGYYDPNANVWNLGSCLPNTAWSNHQRIRQYEGDHDETWGNLTLDIDSDVLEGVVAIPYDYPHVSSIVRVDSNPTSKTNVDFTVNFSKPVTGVNEADFALTTKGGISGASITNAFGTGNTYTVTINTGSGNGSIRLDVVDDDSILDASSNPLGGAGAENGNYMSAEVYTVRKRVVIRSTGDQDGRILESSETSNQGGAVNTIATLLYVGDNAQNQQYRSILSFDTSSLPDDAVITKVQLKIRHNGFAGTNMFTPVKTHNNLVVDIRQPYFGANPSLLSTDFQAASSKNTVGVLTYAPTPGWYTIALNETSFPFVDLSGTTQLRLRFQVDDDDDLQTDILKILSGNATNISDRPALIVEYYVP
jgi:hypothetical protein